MEKRINELNLGDLEAVVGGVVTLSATSLKAPTAPTSGSVYQLPKSPAPTSPASALTATALI